MRLKTVLKELDRILELFSQGRKAKAVELLYQLRNRIELKIKEEEEKEKSKNPIAHSLAKWYYGLWEGRIPEGSFARAVNTFKTLLEEFKLREEEIKETYLWWLNLGKEEVPQNLRKTYNIVLGERETRSITDFKGKLRYVKALKKELGERDWVSEEFKHSEDTYGRNVFRWD
jgi:hypothetical protein